MKIKVCGLKEPDNIKAVAELNPDYIGFINFSRSPRFIANMPKSVIEGLPSKIIKTGVFVNDSVEMISMLIREYEFDAVQLHGFENPEFCKALKGRVTVIKAFGIDEDFDFSQLEPYVGHVDYFLFDTKTDKYGGSGISFNWEVLDNYKLDVPFFLSGGLSLDNLEEVLQINHPQFYLVDFNSRFEVTAGVKDIMKLKTAFEKIRKPVSHEI